MKNLLFVLSGVLFLVAGCNTTPEEPKTTELSYFTSYQNYPENLFGQVKLVEEMNYLVTEIDGKVVKGELLNKEMRDSLRWSLNFTATFDEYGNTLQVDRYYDEGDTRLWKIKSEDNNIVYAKFILDDTVRYYWDDIEYNELNQISNAKYYQAKDDKQLSYYEYTHDEAGNWKLFQGYNPEGEKTYHYSFDFNEKNLNTSYKAFNSSDSLLSDSKIIYNDKGFYIKAEYINGLGEIRRVTEMEYTKYDEMGNWLEANAFDEGKLILVVERKYEYY